MTSLPASHLSSPFTLWFLDRNDMATQDAYESVLRPVCTFDTLPSFARYYAHVRRPSMLSSSIMLHVFREGVPPLWEHERNAHGGRAWIYVKPPISDRVWERVVFSVIGDVFQLGDEVCGCLFNTRDHVHVISVWNANAANREAVLRIRAVLQRIVEDLPNAEHAVEYRAHHATRAFGAAAAAGAAAASSASSSHSSHLHSHSSAAPSSSSSTSSFSSTSSTHSSSLSSGAAGSAAPFHSRAADASRWGPPRGGSHDSDHNNNAHQSSSFYSARSASSSSSSSSHQQHQQHHAASTSSA